MKITLLALLLQGIPETTALVALAFVIAKIPVDWKKIILFGVVLAVCAYTVRQFQVPFGIHIILNITILFIALIRQGQRDISLLLVASFSTYLALAIFETICSSLLMPVFGVTPITLTTDSTIWILIGEPQVFLLFTLAFLLNKLEQKRGRNNGFLVNQ